MTTHYFHFTIGPVQGFVAQARRTRDFWAGSFIVSWLAGVAVKAVQQQGGEILFPAPNKAFLLWLEGKGTGQKPAQGTIPNRFKAQISSHNFSPDQVITSVQQAWKALADLIYAGDLKAVEHPKTREIWERQVGSFWEMSWVITKEEHDNAALDRRKNWRSHLPPPEPGIKCMMMDGLQELSGAPSPVMPHGETLRAFWENLRNQKKAGIKTDLRPGEQLCAIAFIKRRFSRHFKQLKHTMPGDWQLQGWQLDHGRPSVSYMAAVHWLEALVKEAVDDDAFKTELMAFYTQAVQLLNQQHNEWDNNIHCLEQIPESPDLKKVIAVDGNVFFETALLNKRIHEDQRQAAAVLKTLARLRTQAKLSPPSPFYAVLMMDGDSLGAQMSDPAKEEPITRGLHTFTSGVAAIVKGQNGFLLYAGGDDVLAILPLEDAADCALAIRQSYAKSFDITQVQTTISGAIVYAHMKTPLTRVLKESHQLLDEIAKNETGRDSVAIRVLKPGGEHLQWTRPWNEAWNKDEEKPRLILSELADKLATDEKNSAQFSSSFFHKIRERFALLNPANDSDERLMNPAEQGVKLMAADYISSGLCAWVNKKERLEHAIKVIKPLIEQCTPTCRDCSGDICQYEKRGRVEADAALLVRFLAQKGVYHDPE